MAEATPLVVLAFHRRWPRGARAWLTAWVVYLLAIDLVGASFAVRGLNNLWLEYILMPVSVSLALWTLSYWQGAELWRLTFRIAIAPLLLAWGILTLVVDNTNSFSNAAEPTVKLVTLAAAAFTLLAGSLSRRGDLLRQDWFWFSAGMALYFGSGATLGPVSALFEGRDTHLLMVVFASWSLIGSLAFLLIAKGMACPPPTR
jgi:Flp pilus assembly protein TadB